MEKLDAIRNIINLFSEVSEKSLDQLFSILEFKTIEQGRFVKGGMSSTKEYFIFSGFGRVYVTSADGAETTLTFLTPKSAAPPLKTRVSNRKSTVDFEALTELSLAQMESSEFFQLCLDNEEIMILGTKIMECSLIEKSEKEIALATMKGIQRLSFFRNRFPTLENFVSHQYIASYLGITNVSLSRLRSKKSLI